MRWFQYTVEEFERTRNPANAAVIVMVRQEVRDSSGRTGAHMILTEESRLLCGFQPQHTHLSPCTPREDLERILKEDFSTLESPTRKRGTVTENPNPSS